MFYELKQETERTVYVNFSLFCGELVSLDHSMVLDTRLHHLFPIGDDQFELALIQESMLFLINISKRSGGLHNPQKGRSHFHKYLVILFYAPHFSIVLSLSHTKTPSVFIISKKMDHFEKRVSSERNNNGGDDDNIQMVADSDGKRVCSYCKREFHCARGLGGHLKVHSKDKKRMNKRRECGSSSEAPQKMMNNEVRSGDEIIDLSKFLEGCGWVVKKKRGSNALNQSKVMEYESSIDDYIECNSDDSCDEDDYDNIRLRIKLRRYGFTSASHNICWTRRMLMCKGCNKYFKTFHAMFCHVEESKRENEDDGGEEVGQVVNEAAAAVEEPKGNAEDGSEEVKKEK
ncbi:hypothetical protein VNO78_12374 [Psophocarpus tetragonolobus]|uniref:C2H2-type domain-containing protein n=1 Tax=Psophocarpus tetragonolobus TaxID=3891 RepID=A0AAN9XPT2_PSOTE